MSDVEYTATVYLDPETDKGGTMTIGDGGESRPYRLGYLDADITPGLYEVDYKPSGGSIVFLNRVVPRPPEGQDKLVMMLRQVKGVSKRVANNILDFFGEEGILEKLQDPDRLQKVNGVGSVLSERIASSFEEIDEDDEAFFDLLSRFGLDGDATRAWFRFARAVYKDHPQLLEDLKDNPYTIIHLDDHPFGEQVARKHNFNAVTLPLSTFDAALIEAQPRWKHHVYRAAEYLRKIVYDTHSDGHSVISVVEAQRLLRRNHKIQYVIDSLDDNEAHKLELDEIRGIATRTDSIRACYYMQPDGNETWGLTSEDAWRDYRTTYKAMEGLLSADRIISRREAEKMYERAKETVPFDFAPEQKKGLKNAFNSRVSAITGPAGTGKTASSQAYLNGLLLALRERENTSPLDRHAKNKTGHHIYIAAPTGAATQRIRNGLELIDPETDETITPQNITEVIDEAKDFLEEGRVFIGTMHKFLGYRGGDTFNLPAPHPCVIFADEASMADEQLFAQLMRFVQSCMDRDIPVAVLFSGDHNQLPPVGRGFPFRDVLGNGYGAAVPSTKLEVVHRQGKGSMITHACHQILEGRMPPHVSDYESWDIAYDDADFVWHTPQEFGGYPSAAYLLNHYAEYLTDRFDEAITVRDIQVVLPLRNQSQVEPDCPHTRQLNKDLQQSFAEAEGKEVFRYRAVKTSYDDSTTKEFSVRFAQGDKVIHTGENGYHGEDPRNGAPVGPVMRGSIGRIVEANKREMWVQYPWMNRPVPYCQPTERWQLDLAYAITGHASQGSEFDYELLMLPERAAPTLIDRGWLYTAASRAKKHEMMIATHERVRRAVSVNFGHERNTLLTRKMLQF